MKFFQIVMGLLTLIFSSWGVAADETPQSSPTDPRAAIVLNCLRVAGACSAFRTIDTEQGRRYIQMSVKTQKGEVFYRYPLGTRQELVVIWHINATRHVWFYDTNADGSVDRIVEIDISTREETVYGRNVEHHYVRAQQQYLEMLRVAVETFKLDSNVEVKQ